MRLKGKRVLLTGTAGGQGAEAQALFAAEGARVFGCDVQSGAAEASAAKLRADGYSVEGATVDLTDVSAAGEWVDAGVAWLGGLDILYNNAAGHAFQPFATMSLDTWRRSISTELDILFHTTRPAWNYLSRGGGAVINTASLAGIRGVPGQAAHAAAKGGVIGFTVGLAAEGGPLGIRVNSICPGPIDSDAARAALGDEERTWMISRVPLERLGSCADVAACALYLASDEATWITGQNFSVDGGWSTVLR